MKIGDIVRHKIDGSYGTVEYSTFGYSIHTWDEENQALGKTLGYPEAEVLKYWDVVDMPEGYEECEYGGLRKIKNDYDKDFNEVMDILKSVDGVEEYINSEKVRRDREEFRRSLGLDNYDKK